MTTYPSRFVPCDDCPCPQDCGSWASCLGGCEFSGRPMLRFYFESVGLDEMVEVRTHHGERVARVIAMNKLFGARPDGAPWTGAGLIRRYE